MYSIIGWIYEVFLEVVVYKWGFTNRGVLFGPYCPVYGFGVLAFLFTIYPLIKNKPLKQKLLYIPLVFLGCMTIATLLELITSYICEFFIGSWPWQTYARDYKIHFQGRIALSPSLRFGLGGTAFLYILQPLFEKSISKLGEKKVNVIAVVLGIVMVVDCVYTFLIKKEVNIIAIVFVIFIGIIIDVFCTFVKKYGANIIGNVKLKKILLSIIILMIVLIFNDILYKIKFSSKNYEWDSSMMIYEKSYTNYAWGYVHEGYIIYANGDIEEFDNENVGKTLKKDKLSDKELKELKDLICLVRDKSEEADDLISGMDIGITTERVYSPRLQKWITLTQISDRSMSNKTKESKEIQKLAQTLYEKYLKD